MLIHAEFGYFKAVVWVVWRIRIVEYPGLGAKLTTLLNICARHRRNGANRFQSRASRYQKGIV